MTAISILFFAVPVWLRAEDGPDRPPGKVELELHPEQYRFRGLGDPWIPQVGPNDPSPPGGQWPYVHNRHPNSVSVWQDGDLRVMLPGDQALANSLSPQVAILNRHGRLTTPEVLQTGAFPFPTDITCAFAATCNEFARGPHNTVTTLAQLLNVPTYGLNPLVNATLQVNVTESGRPRLTVEEILELYRNAPTGEVLGPGTKDFPLFVKIFPDGDVQGIHEPWNDPVLKNVDYDWGTKDPYPVYQLIKDLQLDPKDYPVTCDLPDGVPRRGGGPPRKIPKMRLRLPF